MNTLSKRIDKVNRNFKKKLTKFLVSTTKFENEEKN